MMTTDATQPDKPVGSIECFNEAAECLRILAHLVRLRIVQMLLHGRNAVEQLAKDAGIPGNVASQHLRLMQRCGFFNSKRYGRQTLRATGLLSGCRTAPSKIDEVCRESLAGPLFTLGTMIFYRSNASAFGEQAVLT